MKKTSIFILLITFFLVSCSVKPSVIITDKQNDNSKEMVKGTVFAVKLKAKLSTGFAWQIVSTGKVVETIGKPEIITAKEKKTGMNDIMVFKFRAAETGKSDILFQYKRHWEKKEPLKIFKIQVSVLNPSE